MSRHYLLPLVLAFVGGSTAIPDYHQTDPVLKDVTSPFICTPNAQGFFGEVSQDVESVVYYYELTADATGLTERTKADMMLDLEIAIATHLLTTALFSEACNDAEPSGNRALYENVGISSDGGQRLLDESGVVGMSVNPPDEPLGIECSTPPVDGTVCDVVQGELLIYTKGEVPGLADTVRGSIQGAMDAGSFNDAHVNIIKVSYVEDIGSFRRAPPTIGGGEITPNDDGGNDNRAVYIGAGVGSVLLLGAIAFYRQRNGKNTVEGDETAVQESSV